LNEVLDEQLHRRMEQEKSPADQPAADVESRQTGDEGNNDDDDNGNHKAHGGGNDEIKKGHHVTEESTTMRIFRMKGILSIRQDNANEDEDEDENEENDTPNNDFIDAATKCDKRKYILQAVHDLWDVYPTTSETFGDTEPRSCKVVVIGKRLDREELQVGFDKCFIV